MRAMGSTTWIAAGLVAACALNAPPVPVEGPPGAVAALVGDWSGEYWSTQTGRSGSIVFHLDADADTAFGDVLMLPRGALPHEHPEGVHPRSEYLSITFVRVVGNRVRGVLDPYRDPVCGCRLHTTFEGVVHGDTIEGTFTTRHLEGGDVHEGRWRVTRAVP